MPRPSFPGGGYKALTEHLNQYPLEIVLKNGDEVVIAGKNIKSALTLTALPQDMSFLGGFFNIFKPYKIAKSYAFLKTTAKNPQETAAFVMDYAAKRNNPIPFVTTIKHVDNNELANMAKLLEEGRVGELQLAAKAGTRKFQLANTEGNNRITFPLKGDRVATVTLPQQDVNFVKGLATDIDTRTVFRAHPETGVPLVMTPELKVASKKTVEKIHNKRNWLEGFSI